MTASTGTSRPGAGARRDWALLGIGLAALAAHASSLPGGFIWLDHTHLEDGRALAPPSEWLTLFTRGFAGTGYYRPLVSLSLSVEALVSRGPLLFRAMTLAWHALAAVLTCVAARVLGLPRRAGLVAGLLLAVHPVTSVVADAIAFRSEAMMTVALLSLVIAHRKGRAGYAAVALLGGALIKETAWLLGPLFIAACEVDDHASRSSSDPAPKRTRLLVAEAGAFAAACGLRALFAPHWRAPYPHLALDEQIGTRLGALGKSVFALVLPVNPSVCDAFPILGFGSLTPGSMGLALVGLGALLSMGFWLRRRDLPARLAVLSLLPALDLVPLPRWWSPHYLYLSLAFGGMVLGREAVRRARGTRLVVAVVAVLLPLLAISAWDGLRYRSDALLWAPEVAREPACLEADFFLGDSARLAHHWDEAARLYALAAAPPPPGYLAYSDRPAALQNLGAMRWEEGRFEDARSAWETSLVMSRDRAQKHALTHNLAAVALRTGDPEGALRLLAPEATRPGAPAETLRLYAGALHALGRDTEAREVLSAATAAPAGN